MTNRGSSSDSNTVWKNIKTPATVKKEVKPKVEVVDKKLTEKQVEERKKAIKGKNQK